MIPPAVSVRTAIDVVDRALVLTKRHFWTLLRLSAIPLLAATGVGYWYGGVGHPPLIRALAALAAYSLYAILYAVTILGAWTLLHGQAVDVAATWYLVYQRSPSIVVAFVVKMALVLLGIVALILPGFYFVAIYFAVPAVNVVEGLGVRRSLVRSRALARGSMLGIIVSIGGVWVLAIVAANLVPVILTRLGVPHGTPLRFVVAMLWPALVVPFQCALAAVMYLELRVRREGYDLEQVMSSMPSAA